MNLVVVSFSGIYYIGINQSLGVETYSKFIMKMLSIDNDDYVKILKHNGAINDNCYNYYNYYFDKWENCKSAIEELEPYLVMKKLMGE